MAYDEFRHEQSPLEVDYSDRKLIRMNLNENLVFPPNLMRSILVKCVDQLDPRYYPDELGTGEMTVLTEEIGRYCGCSSRFVSIGVGGDQLIDLVFRMKLVNKSARLVTVDPTFSLYSVFAKRLDAKVYPVRLNPSTAKEPFSLRKKKILDACRQKDPGLLVLASPNNPTAIQYPVQDLKEILESLPTKTTLLLDEAYMEFAEYDAAKLLLRSYENLVILRTFSKAFALASMRLGYLLSSDLKFVEEFNDNFQYPFPVAGLSIRMAIELLRRKSVVIDHAKKIKTFRKELIESLQKMWGSLLHVVPISHANFVLVQSKEAERIASDLLSRYAIAVRYIPNFGTEKGFLRITVGSRELNQKLLYALRRIAPELEK